MLPALLVTILAEALTMYFLTKSKEWVSYNFYCNIVTNPLLNLALYGTHILFRNLTSPLLVALFGYYIPLIILEAVVFWSEGYLYTLMTDTDTKKCFRLSIISNSVSAALGIIYSVFYFFS